MNVERKNRNTLLYLIQILMAISIIPIHLAQYNLNGFELYLETLGKSTVLFFFGVSGAFYYKKNKNASIKESYNSSFKKIIRLLLIAFIVLLFTFLYKIIIDCSLDLGNISLMIRNRFNVENLIHFLLFNGLTIAEHMWFVFALIYVYLLAPIIIKGYKKFPKYYFIFSIIVLIAVYAFTLFFRYKFDEPFRYMITRNWLFEGIPAFLIGVHLNENENVIKNYFINIKKKNVVMLLFAIQIFIFLDAYLMSTTNIYFEFCLLNPLLVVALLSLAFTYPNSKIGNRLLRIFGDKCSTIIYMIHPLVVKILCKVFKIILPNKNCYLLVLLLTIIIALIMSFLYERFIFLLGKKKGNL